MKIFFRYLTWLTFGATTPPNRIQVHEINWRSARRLQNGKSFSFVRARLTQFLVDPRPIRFSAGTWINRPHLVISNWSLHLNWKLLFPRRYSCQSLVRALLMTLHYLLFCLGSLCELLFPKRLMTLFFLATIMGQSFVSSSFRAPLASRF